jgi:SAM-dependent methyltransferase
MKKLDFQNSYADYVKSLSRMRNTDAAMKKAIGGEFDAIGLLERSLLIQHGLEPGHYLIDVGCGSGRLASPLSEYLEGKYLGTDVVPDLVEYARRLANRSDWRFEVVGKLNIPEKNEKADMVCFFSVFTHLLHEQSYVYLQEAKRVLRPGGKIVFSFLEFSVYCQWTVFEGNIKDIDGNHPLNMFMSRDAIQAWASHLELEIEGIFPGDIPHIKLASPVRMENGTLMEEMGNLGQSVCVLRKS